MAAKRMAVTVVLDEERYGIFQDYKSKKGADNDEVATLIINTGLSRIQALSKHAAKGGSPKPKAERAKPKAAAKPKAEKKAKAKPAAKAAAKPKTEKKEKPRAAAKPAVAKAAAKPDKPKGPVVKKANGAARVAPQRPAAAAPVVNSQPTSAGEVAQA